MPDSYVIKDQQGVYFLTFHIVGWLDIFTRKRYRDIVVDAFNYCVATKGLRVHAWCMMSNHVHCILSSATGTLSDTIKHGVGKAVRRVRILNGTLRGD